MSNKGLSTEKLIMTIKSMGPDTPVFVRSPTGAKAQVKAMTLLIARTKDLLEELKAERQLNDNIQELTEATDNARETLAMIFHTIRRHKKKRGS